MFSISPPQVRLKYSHHKLTKGMSRLIANNLRDHAHDIAKSLDHQTFSEDAPDHGHDILTGLEDITTLEKALRAEAKAVRQACQILDDKAVEDTDHPLVQATVQLKLEAEVLERSVPGLQVSDLTEVQEQLHEMHDAITAELDDLSAKRASIKKATSRAILKAIAGTKSPAGIVDSLRDIKATTAKDLLDADLALPDGEIGVATFDGWEPIGSPDRNASVVVHQARTHIARGMATNQRKRKQAKARIADRVDADIAAILKKDI